MESPNIYMYQIHGRHTKPCHARKKPRDHYWLFRVSGCGCGYMGFETEYVCDHCGWGFSADSLLPLLPVSNLLFTTSVIVAQR